MHVEAKSMEQIVAKLFIVISGALQSGLARWPNDRQVKNFELFYIIFLDSNLNVNYPEGMSVIDTWFSLAT